MKRIKDLTHEIELNNPSLHNTSNKIVKVQNLGLMITQNCNYSCAHCYRGKCRNESITDKVLNETFKKISIIVELSLEGGEPSLSVEKLSKALYYIKGRRTIIYGANITTNATNITPEFIKILKDFENYVTKCQHFLPEKKQNLTDSFCIRVSLDKYHLAEAKRLKIPVELLNNNINLLKENFRCVKLDTKCNDTVIDVGSAKSLENIKKVPKFELPFSVCANIPDLYRVFGFIGINCDGKVGNIDMSNDDWNNPELVYGNITTDEIGQIVKNSNCYKVFENELYAYMDYKNNINKLEKSKIITNKEKQSSLKNPQKQQVSILRKFKK